MMHVDLIQILILSNAAHDASTGFHDIKPVSNFHPSPTHIYIALAVFGILLVCIFCYRFFKKRRALLHNEQEIDTPYHVAQKKLEKLGAPEQTASSLRAVAGELSFILREYIESTMKFPATDKTTSEISLELPQTIRSSFPGLPPQFYDEINDSTVEALSTLERIIFGPTAEEMVSSDSTEVSSMIETAKELLQKIEGHRTREQQRVSGVVSESLYEKTNTDPLTTEREAE